MISKMIPAGAVGYYVLRALGKPFGKWVKSDHPSVAYVGGTVMVLGWILVIGVAVYIVSLIFSN
jgi:hypothetical protein